MKTIQQKKVKEVNNLISTSYSLRIGAEYSNKEYKFNCFDVCIEKVVIDEDHPEYLCIDFVVTVFLKNKKTDEALYQRNEFEYLKWYNDNNGTENPGRIYYTKTCSAIDYIFLLNTQKDILPEIEKELFEKYKTEKNNLKIITVKERRNF